MTNKIGKTMYPEMVLLDTQRTRLDDDTEVKLTRFQYLDWTQIRTIYVPADIEEDGVFYHAGCRYELPRHLDIDRELYTRTEYNTYSKEV